MVAWSIIRPVTVVFSVICKKLRILLRNTSKIAMLDTSYISYCLDDACQCVGTVIVPVFASAVKSIYIPKKVGPYQIPIGWKIAKPTYRWTVGTYAGKFIFVLREICNISYIIVIFLFNNPADSSCKTSTAVVTFNAGCCWLEMIYSSCCFFFSFFHC